MPFRRPKVGSGDFSRHLPFYIDGNRLTLFTKGGDVYRAMWRAIESAKETVHIETYIFSSDRTGREFAKRLEAKAREVRMTVDGQPEICVDGNSELLRSAFENVIRNALRYTPEASTVRIRIETAPSQNTPSVKITIEDRGPGVPTEELENIFKPFYRLDVSRERSTGGVGLGLAIAQRAIRLHHGDMRAYNSERGGLAVEITLPQAPTAA